MMNDASPLYQESRIKIFKIAEESDASSGHFVVSGHFDFRIPDSFLSVRLPSK